MSVADRLAAMASQASGSAGISDPSAARAALRRALEAAYTQIGKDHPTVLESTRVLAALHRRDGELSEARTLLEEAMAAGYFTRGVDHPVMLGLAYDLGVLADELENRHEARTNFDRVRRLGPGVLGPDHEYVRAADRYLAGMNPPAPMPPPPPPDDVRPLWPDAPGAVTPTKAAAPAESSWFAAAAPPPSTPPALAPPAGVSGPPATPGPPTPGPPTPGPPTPGPPTPGPPTPGPLTPGPPRPAPAQPPSRHRHTAAAARRAVGARAPAIQAAPPRSRFVPVVLLMALAIVLAAGATVLVLQFVNADRDEPALRTSPPTAPSSAVPIQLGLQDSGTAVTLTWTDPSNGAVPFVVAYGLADGPADRSQRLTAGTTTITINGLNPQVNYCFTVAGIESTTAIALSHALCTRRNIAGQPSASGRSPTG